MIEQALKITLLIVAIIIGLYVLDVTVVVDTLNAATVHWNNAVIYVTTFKDRHPYIMLFMPVMVLILLATMKGDLDFAEP